MIRALVAAFALTVSTFTFADTVEHNLDEGGTAIKGYDTVAYFTQGEAVKGNSEFSAEHMGATYFFSSAENRALFVNNPEKYAPQYGGFCAYGVSKGRKYDVDPTAFKVVDNKLYLNYNARVQEIWSADQSNLISEAEGNWGAIKAKTDAELAAAEE